MVYTHPLVTSTCHVQNSKFSLYSQNMLQNIIPQKMLQNTLTDHRITSPRGVIAPLEVMRHLNSVQALNAHTCAVRTTNSFTAQPHDGAKTLQINSWRECTQSRWVLRTVQFGYRLQFAASPPAFQRDNSFSGAGKIKACSSGRNFLSVEQKGDKSGPTRAEPHRVLLEVLPCPKERDSSSSSHIRSACTEQVLKEVQVQNAHPFYTPKLVRHGDWFTSIDLKDAYFHIKIYPPHRKFLRFAFLGVAYEYLVLPFGLSLSPRVFVKCTEAVLTPLR